MKKILTVLSFGLMFSFLAGCTGGRWFTVSTRLDIPLYARPVSPGDGFIWIEGEWFWNGNNYHWRDGYWSRPRDGYRWNPGYWRKNPGGWYWQPGRWKR